MTLQECWEERMQRADMLSRQVRTGMHIPHGRCMGNLLLEVMHGLQVMVEVMEEVGP